MVILLHCSNDFSFVFYLQMVSTLFLSCFDAYTRTKTKVINYALDGIKLRLTDGGVLLDLA